MWFVINIPTRLYTPKFSSIILANALGYTKLYLPRYIPGKFSGRDFTRTRQILIPPTSSGELRRCQMRRFALFCFLALTVALAVQFQAYAEAGREVKEFIKTLEVGEPVYYENLTIIPIYSTAVENTTACATLDEALEKGWLVVSELEGGRVPQVSITNNSKRYIYLMGGEILTGCRQDRILGRDVLIKPHSKNIVVPVYCVEQGRWDYQSEKFYSKSNLGTYDLRREAQTGAPSAQSTIWENIADASSRFMVSSQTDAYQEMYEAPEVKRRVQEIEQRFQNIPQLNADAIGVVVGIGSRIVSVDLFANPDLFRKLWPKLLKTSAFSALDCYQQGSITPEDAADFLRSLHAKHYIQKPAIDLGFEVSVIDGEVNANALVYRQATIHLAAFSQGYATQTPWQYRDEERRVPVMRRGWGQD